jgi:hypothetical protein
MKMLRFTAEASLYCTDRHYCIVWSGLQTSTHDGIVLAGPHMRRSVASLQSYTPAWDWPPTETCVGRGTSTCSQFPSPQICVYGYCRPCVPSGEECRLYGSQLCCNPDDSCVLDINDEKVKCAIPG